MIGFRVRVNQDRVVTIGLDGDHSVSVMITATDKEERSPAEHSSKLRIGAGGFQLSDRSQTYLSWLDRPLKMGDTISIEVANVPTADAPTPRPGTGEWLEKFERKQLEALLKKYGQP